MEGKTFALWYVGWSRLDRRTTLPMLPWLVAEIRRRSERSECGGPAGAREVSLSLWPPVVRCVPASSCGSSVFIFEHKAQFISRFVHNSNDLSYFAYLIRSQPDDPESETACHVFKARDPNQVPEVISSIRQVSKAALKEKKSRPESDESFYDSQKFEVLYCGKVTVSQKKAPAGLIDDCVQMFRQHEVDRKLLRSLAAPPVDFLLGEEPVSSVSQEDLLDVELRTESFPEEQQEVRSRCSSLAGGLRNPGTTRRRHASAPNHVQPSDAQKNRTMLFQVGRFEVNLISPDTKSVVLEKNFKDISSCSQGVKHTDHFGLLCRDAEESQYVCYIFQCASESLVDEVMLTMKQAFSTAAVLQSSKNQIKLCEACPMHDLHKLCERIEGLYPPRAKLVIQKHLSQLSDGEQASIFERVQKSKPTCDQEENELVILHLRQLCETKQKSHVHIGETSQASVSDSTSTSLKTLDVVKNKAKGSLTSSLENIFSRGASRMRMRLGSMGSFERGDSPGHSPPGTPPSYLEEDPEAPQFRRRAHTFSHPPIRKRISFSDVTAPLRRQQSLGPELLQNSITRVRSVSESASLHTPAFLKGFYSASLASVPDSGALKSGNGEGRRRSVSACSTDSLSLATPPRVSWRQKIFLRVASPMNKPSAAVQNMDHSDGRELLPLSPGALGRDQELRSRSAGEKDYRLLWRKAIHQQILLIRMEKENQRLEASRDELHIRKMKLDYQEVCESGRAVQELWDRKLSSPCRAMMVQWNQEEIQSAVCQGVPKQRRGDVWLLLSQQHRLRQLHSPRPAPPDTPYQELLKQLTSQQHAILVDLGRTFPTHPYFSAQLGAGQLSLYNLLKAYSLLDAEVGYCQGISFVAGLLLLHMSEEQAFDTLKFLMYDLGIRQQYRPDMLSLQIQMYQLSRLLHDYQRGLFAHLEEAEICPSLWAAPWFLTLFASQFPLGFVARVFDLLFVQGTEVIFKVALCLLSSHEGEILECDGFESIVEHLKTSVPTLTHSQMEEIIAKAVDMDVSQQLQAYEVEYHVLQDELTEAPAPGLDSQRLDKLEKANSQLKKQNMELLEKLQAARLKIQTLESSVESFLSRESKMKQQMRCLEQEKTSCLKAIQRMRSSLPSEAVEMIRLKPDANGRDEQP